MFLISTLVVIIIWLEYYYRYPLVFVGTRDGIFDLANVSVEKRSDDVLVNHVTLLTLALITVGALIVKDLSFVLSFGGATVGSALIYVFPALMYRKLIQSLDTTSTTTQKAEVIFAMFSATLGIIMGAIGAFISLKSN